MESSIQPVTNRSSSETELDTLMMTKVDTKIYSGKANKQQNEMDIEEKVNCNIKLICLI